MQAVRRRVGLFTAALTVGSLLTAVATPASAAPKDPPTCETVRPDAAAADAMAKLCGRRVEVLAERTEQSQTFANPDGTTTFEVSVAPERVRRGSTWVPVDTALVKTADGLAPKASVMPVTFSGGGHGPLAKLTNGSRELAISWPGTLPTPVLYGDIAIYRNVLPDVDLHVTATATGFSEVVVVKTPQAAANPKLASLKFGLATKGVTVHATPTGGLVATDDKGETVFTAPAPQMWDSTVSPNDGGVAEAPATTTDKRPADKSTTVEKSDKADAAEGSAGQRALPAKDVRKAVMPVTVDGDQLVLKPDQKLLKNPRAKFPIYIDPSFDGRISDNAWTTVWSKYPGSSFWRDSSALLNGSTSGTVGAGRTEDCSSCADYIVRSMFRMNVARAAGNRVISAKFMIEQRHSWTCSPKSNAKLWLMNSTISSTTTWNKQPTWNSSYTATTAANRKLGAIHGCSGPGTIEFNATSMVAKAAASKSSTLTVGLRAIDEGTKQQWKRFKHSTAKLTYTINRKPNVPSEIRTDGKSCATGTSRPYVLTATPDLSAKMTDPDGAEEGDLVTHVYWWPLGGSRNETNKIVKTGGHESTVRATIPSGKLVNGGTYVWQARSYDGLDYGGWTATCEFTVDLTPPPSPGGISSTQYPADAVPHGGVNIPGTFTVTAPVSQPQEVESYAYTLDSGVQPSAAPRVVAQAGTYGATITLTPTRDGVHTLRVWARDKAGWYSTTPATHTFTVRAGSGPASDWTFDETSGNAADVAHSNLLTVTGATRVTGRGGQGNALSLNGSSQYAATTGPVLTPNPDNPNANLAVRTDQSFTVSARVRISSTGGTEQKGIVTASGTRTSAFTLGYSAPDNKWRFAISGSDVDAPAIYAVLSNATVATNKWVHLTGTFDASNGQVRLYVNGVLQTATATASTKFNTTGSVVVGRRLWAGVNTGYFAGQVDDVRLYNFVETATRIGGLAAPLPAKVTFPNGASVNVGEQLTVVFDGGGDENVTSFKYAVDSSSLTQTATLGTPGGTVTRTIPGAGIGPHVLLAEAHDANRPGPQVQHEFVVASAAGISGTVVNGSAGNLPLSGATVGIGPLGGTPALQMTAGTGGEYGFTGLAAGEYTVSGSYGGRCGLTGAMDVLIDQPDIRQDLELFTYEDLGYTCEEQTTAFAPANQTLAGMAGDNVSTKIPLPFAFPFYGQVFYEAWIDSNGYVSFVDPGGSHPYTGTGNVPQVTTPNAVVAPFWDDLVVDASASVRTALTGTGGAARFTIEWNNVYRKANSSHRVSFETILAPDGTVTNNYAGLDSDAEKGASAVVGIEAPSGESGLIYSRSQPALQNGRAVVFKASEVNPLFDLSGVLTNAAGAGVVGVTVSIEPLGLSTVTGTGGAYRFDDLPEDSYGLTAKAGNRCATVARAQVELTANTVTNLQLQPDYGGMGYACSPVTSAYRSDTSIFPSPTAPFTGDDARTTINFPFPVKLHGTAYTSGWVDTNGLLGMGPIPTMAGDKTATNLAMPNADMPNGFLAPFWDDLDVDSSASIRTLSTGAAPNRTFIVEWRNVKMYPSLARTTFEILIHENGEFTFAYAGDMTSAAQRANVASIGIETGSGSAATQYSFQEDVLTNNLSLRFTPAPPGTVSGTLTTAVTGALVPGAQVTLTPAGLAENTPLTTTTDSSGNYQFTSVPVGEYIVRASTNDGRCAGQAGEQTINHEGGTSDIDLSVMTAGDEGGYTCTYGPQTYIPAADDLGIDGDGFNHQVQPSFPIKLYGFEYTQAWISDDGVLALRNPDVLGDISWIAAPIPSTGPDGEPNAALYPFWTDWGVDAASSIRTGEVGTAPNRRFVVEWRNVYYAGVAGDTSQRVTFEVIIDEGGDITFVYADINSANPIERGSIATVGIEDDQGLIAFQYANKDSWLATGQGVKFHPNPPGPGSVFGAVSCAGSAVTNATVAVAGQQATTAADGTYAITNVSAGTYAAVATVPDGTCVGSKVLPVIVGTGTDRMIDFELTATAANAGYTLTEQTTTFVPANTTVLSLPTDDSYTTVAFPFNVKLYGQTYSTGYVGDNGLVTFLTPNGASDVPLAIPSAPAAGQPNAAVYPFWYDWVVDSQSSVRTAQTADAAPNRKFIVEWRNVRSYQEPDLRVSFEVIFEETGGFTFAYADLGATSLERGGNSTIGIENAAGTVALQYTFRSPVLRPGNGVRITPPAS